MYLSTKRRALAFLPAWLILALALVCSFILWEEAMGATLSYGVDVPYSPWRTPGVKFQVLELETRSQLIKNLELGISGQIQQATADSPYVCDGWVAHGRERSLQCHGRLIYTLENWELFGGFGLRTDRHQMEYGTSKVLGHFGINLMLGDLSVGVAHYSDPLQHHDKGRNFLMIGWRW